MELEVLIVSEISQERKDKYYTFLLLTLVPSIAGDLVELESRMRAEARKDVGVRVCVCVCVCEVG